MEPSKWSGTRALPRNRRLAPLFGEAGSQTIEFALVALPLFAVFFLFIDVAWLFFAKASLQYAVQAGVRAAVTGYVPTTNGQTPGFQSYLKSTVQSNAMGFLSGQTGTNAISVCFYSPGNLSQCLSGSGADSGGNVVQISVSNVSVPLPIPMFGNAARLIQLSATCSDVMESSPITGAPTL